MTTTPTQDLILWQLRHNLKVAKSKAMRSFAQTRLDDFLDTLERKAKAKVKHDNPMERFAASLNQTGQRHAVIAAPDCSKPNTMFEAPPETKYNVLSLGAGVQSSCLALMAAKGEIAGPPVDFCVFSDTQAEPQEVYDWLNWLEKQLPFPVYRVTKGDLTADSLKTHQRKDGSGERVNNLIPAFGLLPDGTKTAAIGRKCTADYKIAPLNKKVKELCGIKRGQKNVDVTMWIGISLDEVQRMKVSRQKWSQHRWPLIEQRMNRADCLAWMKRNGYPEPPRSACYYCPFHSDAEWRRLRDTDYVAFRKAIEFDKLLRMTHRYHNKRLNMEVYLHNSCKPLDEIDFDSDEDKGQQVWDFQAECEGMCGI